ncbi:hypothetical protein EOL96_03530 [Candidatus Saccharibacteria bacterium]|nr:hypothetical protein [Candidatus Saccharibacteria bacterium]
MVILTKELLENLGIVLSEQDYALLADHFETTLHDRVINEIAMELSPEKAHELASMQNTSEDELLVWLQTNVTDLAEIVSDEVDILLGEIAESSEALQG